MTRRELEARYEEFTNDYALHNLEQLKLIHGIDVSEIAGYLTLTDEHRSIFDKVIIKFMNANGLDKRKMIKPTAINYVYEVTYSIPINEKQSEVVSTEVFRIDSKTNEAKKRLHRYIFEKGVVLKSCNRRTEAYLRFELKLGKASEWYHIKSASEWY